MLEHKDIVVATHNIDKQKEINRLLKDLDINVLGMESFPNIKNIDETGSTLIENSFIKSKTVHQITGLPCLADDTGLEVDALNGAPGVFSARYAGKNATYNDNVKKLLIEMNSIEEDLRTARFRTVITYVDGINEIYDEGLVEGKITRKPSGSGGFGYDSIFIPSNFEKTYAEMSKIRKSKISHRALALAKIKKRLELHFRKGETIR